MNGFDTPIPSIAIAVWLCLAIVLLVAGHVRLRRILRPRHCLPLSLLRLAALILLTLLLLRPYRRERLPDRDGFRVAVLVDASQSMGVGDIRGGRKRIDIVREAVRSTETGSLVQRLGKRYRLDLMSFAESVRMIHPGAPVPYMPGRTALGDALRYVLAENSPAPLGAVLVLSDGHGNAGESPVEAGKLYRARGIPISTVGIGDSRRMGDVRVRFADEHLTCRKGDDIELRVIVENQFDNAKTTWLTVGDGADFVVRRKVSIPGGERRLERIRVAPWRAGFLSYSARIDPVKGDTRSDDDVDYAGVEVREPDTFKILFLGAHMDWEYRFLKILADHNEQVSLAAVIRTGPTSVYQVGLEGESGEEGRCEALPRDAATFNRFDAILFDTRAAPLLGTAGVEALVNFVDHRGGGLLLVGPQDGLPQPLLDVLPIPVTPAGHLRRKERLDVNPDFIFDHDPTGSLQTPGGLPLYPGDTLWLSPVLKRSARRGAGVRGSEATVLSAQSYGSGRCAFLGMESTWRWRLGDAGAESGYTAFWNALLVWLSSSSRQRVQTSLDGSKVGIGETVVLDVDVLGRDFLPSTQAQVVATVKPPSGEEQEIRLDPSIETPGRYTGVFFPEDAGEYTVEYRIETAEETLTKKAHFLARKVGRETEDTRYREDVLRDLVRITGGRFVGYRDMGHLTEVPLSREVPVKISKRYWADHVWVLLCLAGVLAAEWFLRRRLGLK